MGGGLMQLVAYGAQDIYLTGNPQITFFKVVYRRHTNFSMECIEQTFNGTTAATASLTTATISRNGDLIGSMHLDVLMSSTANGGATAATYANWTNNTGHAFVDWVELEIGGQRIDKHYGHWLDVWNELTDHDQHERSLLNKHSAKNSYLRSATATGALQLYVPLKFWFNRNPGLALPLIALQYHEVKVKLQTRGNTSLINHNGTAAVTHTNAPTVKLWVDYIYLDTDERRRFAQQSHEYLIEQLQYQQESMADSVRLNLNHPVKELVWTVQTGAAATADTTGDATANIGGTVATNGNDWFNYHSMASAAARTEVVNGQTSYEGFNEFKLQLNGHDRFAKRKASYFRTVQPYQCGHVVPEKHVYCYSFALKPEEHQPSGTCNFSRIDNARMEFTSSATGNINVYAVNYNVLRVMSGMGGLAYSN
jgi:hypothetical protein